MTTSDPTNHRKEAPRQGRNPKFTVDDFIEAALSCVEDDGLEAINMRSVAAKLGASPTTLYRYVADRDELIAATVDGALAGLKLPPTPAVDNVREWLNLTAQAIRTCLLQYPGTADYLLLNGPAGPNSFALMSDVCKVLGSTGRTPARIAAAYDWLVTTVAVYVSKEDRLRRIGGGPTKAKAVQKRFLLEGVDLSYLRPIIATITGDMEMAFLRTTGAVVDAIVDQDAPWHETDQD